ncbi:MAG: flagellar type III secretion system pore protein FliP [Alphaproteobacteria bacterium]|nr:flagellar type III secretion system pore protein FliP [Alphaproteobacteria bacterium]
MMFRKIPKKYFIFFLVLPFFFYGSFCFAQAINIDLGKEGTLTGRIIQLMALLAVLSLAPALLVMVTSFTRIVVVLSLLRSALGVQQTPPNPVLISLALFLTAFIMGPVFEDAYEQGIKPMMQEQINEMHAIELAAQPFKKFMAKNTREEDLGLFLSLSNTEKTTSIEDLSLKIVIPAFMISELRRAFEIGFLIFIPFLIIDMVVSSILMSMGMMMLPPITISLPFKIIFFVLIDGWYLIAGSLIKSYG